MSLLFLGAADYRITAGELDHMKREFSRLHVETSRKVLKSTNPVKRRRLAVASGVQLNCTPRLHSISFRDRIRRLPLLGAVEGLL
jgi:hypothetical protein